MYRAVLFWISQKRWLLIAALLAAILYLLPAPADLTLEGYRTLIITLILVILIVAEPVPLPATALLIVALQVVLQIADINEVARNFMSDAVFFIMGSLMIAVAIVRQGLDARLTLVILAITGTRTKAIMWGFYVISILLTSFMGEHTIVAMLLPVALMLVRNTDHDPEDLKDLTRLFLFAIVYGSILGSMGTPSGGARNAILMEYLSDFGLRDMSYLEWMLFAYPVMLVQIPIGGFILMRMFKPELISLDHSVRKLKVQVARGGAFTAQQGLAIGIFGLVFLGWIFLSSSIGIGTVAILGVFLYLATGLVQWQEINQRTNWGVVLLYAAAISLGIQLRNTGAAFWVAQQFVDLVGPAMREMVIIQYAVTTVFTTIFVNIMSPSATVAVMAPVFMNLGGDPVLLGLATAISSGAGYLTAVGAPAGMIVASAGYLSPKDFLRTGWRFTLMSIIFLLIALVFYWPMIK